MEIKLESNTLNLSYKRKNKDNKRGNVGYMGNWNKLIENFKGRIMLFDYLIMEGTLYEAVLLEWKESEIANECRRYT